MKAFADLYVELDSTTRTNRKVAALTAYLSTAPPADAAWAVYFLTGRRVKRLVLARNLRQWAAQMAEIPDWLFEECYDRAGDLAETIALLLPPPPVAAHGSLAGWVEDRLLPLQRQSEDKQRDTLRAAWRELDHQQRFLWNKLLTGGFRVGVSERLVVRALAKASGLEPPVIAHRLMGAWEPTPAFFSSLVSPGRPDDDRSKPYPFFLAHPLERTPETLGDSSHWFAEWKWDGIRAQVIRRQSECFIWSRGEELITDRFPEIAAAARLLPDGTALDGEIVIWKDGILPFAQLQRRIGRKTIGKKLLADAPARCIVFDMLERRGEDIRKQPLHQRRRALEELFAELPGQTGLALSQTVPAANWVELARERGRARERRVEGLMLKRLDSAYGVGRERGPWWKWKIDPYTVDAVLIYAQRGHGRRAGLFTDYTFGVWHEGELVPFAKAYSGLTDEEIREVDAFVRRNTLEQFGPVRRVEPQLVFELAFENIQDSPRHKSGIAVRFPRMSRWRKDKQAEDADSLALVRSLIKRH